jgi:hypothetical protein
VDRQQQSIFTAQFVLGDEAQLFPLLDGLLDDKKNLLATTVGRKGDKRF